MLDIAVEDVVDLVSVFVRKGCLRSERNTIGTDRDQNQPLERRRLRKKHRIKWEAKGGRRKKEEEEEQIKVKAKSHEIV